MALVTRRAFITVFGVTGMIVPKVGMARTGLHVSGQLVEDTSDLQLGYFALCGSGTGQCQAKDAIAISVHPANAAYLDPLKAMVGKPVQISVFTL